MRSIINSLVLSLACFFQIGSFVQADVVWNEPVQGDLSTSPATPTALNFMTGSNTVIGTLTPDSGDLRDYMTFTVGPNQFLTGLMLDSLVANGIGFQGINSGNTSFIPDSTTAGNFLGLEFVSPGNVGSDMLPSLATSSGSYGSIGFTIPLGPGTYSYVIQEITPGQSMNYQLSFIVVPEPSSVALFCVAGLLSSIRRRRS